MKFIIANWKAHKDVSETKEWIATFKRFDLSGLKNGITIIICPPYPFLPIFRESFKDDPIVKLGAQDISFYHAGSYTGEVAAHTLTSLARYVLIGHSERRKYFHETDATVEQKAANAQDFDIEPIVCVRGVQDGIPKGIKMVVYEPIHAIGTGNNEPIERVLKVKKQLQLEQDAIFIYGGSVNETNATEYLKNDEIDGVLPGGASLDPDKFYKIATSI